MNYSFLVNNLNIQSLIFSRYYNSLLFTSVNGLITREVFIQLVSLPFLHSFSHRALLRIFAKCFNSAITSILMQLDFVANIKIKCRIENLNFMYLFKNCDVRLCWLNMMSLFVQNIWIFLIRPQNVHKI